MFPFDPISRKGRSAQKAFPVSPTTHLAKASLAPPRIASSSRNGLPFEGQLYDNISFSNFLDLDKLKFTAQIAKSIPSNLLSNLLDADLPAKVTISGNAGTVGADGAQFNPVGKAALNIRLLDLGASDSRQKGFLRFKASARTNGRRDHGFEIDRKVQLFNMAATTLYGNVVYKTTNKSQGEWKTTSSFGVHQDFKIAGIKFAARLGLTPDGDFVYDLRL